MVFTCKLPPEIEDIVREFSLPLLRYPGEYKEALQELGLRDWPVLKEKLSTSDAFYILKFLQSYLLAHRAEVKAKQLFMAGGSSLPWVKAHKNTILIYNELTARL